MGFLDKLSNGIVGKIPVVGPIASKVIDGISGGSKQAQPQQVAQNNPALGNALNGSGGKVMMEIPANKAESVAALLDQRG